MPPMPNIPNVLPLGSWPIGVLPRHLPSRIATRGMVACRKAPSMRKIPTSAVASSTAMGVLDMKMPAVNQLTNYGEWAGVWRRAFLGQSIDIDVVVSSAIVADILE
jgi:hypothetical protein